MDNNDRDDGENSQLVAEYDVSNLWKEAKHVDAY